jgi:glutathione synthase/RimK-type ligase-like ATP-grasp enzyme
LLLIAGGRLDPNLQALADTATAMGVEWADWRCDKDASPPCHWDLSAHAAALPWGGDGPGPLGAFVRQDVFASLADPRPEVAQRALGWFTAVQGWLLASGVRHFNVDMSAQALNKPAALLCARQHGLRIPATWVSNDTARMKERPAGGSIAKPVAGGGLCQTLEEALAQVDVAYSAMPALIQPRLAAPELRLFIVGDDAHAFRVDSPSLDYRAEQDAAVTAVDVPGEVHALRALMKTLRMDFGAADFKTDPDTGALVFLELNTSPMFARFDFECGGALTRSMVRQLVA